MGGAINFITRDIEVNEELDENPNEWQVKMSKARSSRDLRPMKLNSITREATTTAGSISNVKSQFEGNFERVSVSMDSGAIDSVAPPYVGQAFPIIETYASKNNIKYKGANDSPIENFGPKYSRAHG